MLWSTYRSIEFKIRFIMLLGEVNERLQHKHLGDRWVANHSSRTLSATEKDILARGLNFAQASRRLPAAEIAALLDDGLELKRTSHLPPQHS